MNNSDGLTSLREALASGADEIRFGNGVAQGGTNFTDNIPDVISVAGNASTAVGFTVPSTTIIGPGANLLTIDGKDFVRVFTVEAGTTARIEGLTISGGNSVVDLGQGGGIRNSGVLTVSQCSVTENTALRGGGIWNEHVLVIQESTIAFNTADFGAGIFNHQNFSGLGSADIRQSTLSNNTAQFSGGGIHNRIPLTLNQSTIALNSAPDGGGINGGVISNNSILVGNSTEFDISGSIEGYSNLIGDPNSSGGMPDGFNNNIVGRFIGGQGKLSFSEVLSPLADNGGTTKTHQPAPNSLAIDADDVRWATENGQLTGSRLTYDQRGNGFSRIVRTLDIGAVERATPPGTTITHTLASRSIPGLLGETTFGGGYAGGNSAISDDGRFVAFSSTAVGLVPNDTNGVADVFVYDRQTNVMERVSVGSSGAQGNGEATGVSISADGQIVTFSSKATNLVADDDNTVEDVFVHNRLTHTTERISTRLAMSPSISGDGRYIAYQGKNSDGTRTDIYIYDRTLTTTVTVSINGATEANGDSANPSVSADGRYIAFESYASNLVAGDLNATSDVFVYDRQSGVMEIVSNGNGEGGNNASMLPSISENGRYVAFVSFSDNLVTGDTNFASDVFVRDRVASSTGRVSISSTGNELPGATAPRISRDGQHVMFRGGDLANPTPVQSPQIYIHDQGGDTFSVSLYQGAPASGLHFPGALSADGRFASFSSNRDFGTNDHNQQQDFYTWDRQGDTLSAVSLRDQSLTKFGSTASEITLSSDGRFLAYTSRSNDIITGDSNFTSDVFLFDKQSNTTIRVNSDSTAAFGPAISGNGRYVAYLVYGALRTDAFLFDRLTSTAERVNIGINGDDPDGSVHDVAVSQDGRFVVFSSDASNLVPDDTNFSRDIFVRDRLSGTTERVNVSNSGVQANLDCRNPSISADGRYVSFESLASNLVPEIANGSRAIFRFDRTSRTIRRVSVNSEGEQANADSFDSSMSSDGRFITFNSSADNLVAMDTNFQSDVFVFDITTNSIERVSVNAAGEEGDGTSYSSSISADGRYVAFQSSSSNFIRRDTLNSNDIYVFDRTTRSIRRINVDALGGQATGEPESPLISGDGQTIAFLSTATNLDGATGPRYMGSVFHEGRNAFLSTVTDNVHEIDDLVLFDPASGRWRLGVSNGSAFTWTNGPKWNPAAGWQTFTGDFNGDGLTDGLGVNNTNGVFLARNNGDGTMTTVSAGSFANETLQHLMVGDFNGDGRDDLIVQFATNAAGLPGSWYTKSWTGTTFVNSFYGRWEATGWTAFVAGDVNNDGASDIIGLRDATGLDRTNITYGISNIIPGGSRRFATQLAGALTGKTATVGWHSVLVGDWDNDGRADLAARRNDGRFYYATATGAVTSNVALGANRLIASIGPLFGTASFNGPFEVGDFNGDGRDDILARQSNNRNLWVALTNAATPVSGTAQLWGTWNDTRNWSGAAIGDFNGDGLSDYASVDLTGGHAWVAQSTGTAFQGANSFGLITGTEPLVGPLRLRRGTLS